MELQELGPAAHSLVDWMESYLSGIEHHPVRSRSARGELLSQLPSDPPLKGEPFGCLLADVDRLILPGITHWQHPRFFAYFPANSSPPGILAEMLIAALGVQGMLWETSPACNELETRVCDWMRMLVGLPESFVGSIQDSGSSANLVAMLAGRERATGGKATAKGLKDCAQLTVYTSQEAHSSILKAAKVLGIGADNVRKIAIDDKQAMVPAALASAISADRAAGFSPACVIGCVGATGLGSMDPIRAIGEICSEEQIYFHVDGAWAGSAMILPEQRHLIDGIELADSFVLNPHKWLLTGLDCSLLYLREPREVAAALAVNPAYLVSPESEGMPEYRDWGIPLGRRFRALKLWFVLRSFGVEAIQAMLRRHIAWAAELGEAIAASPRFELVAGPRLSLLAFRWRPSSAVTDEDIDSSNELLLARVNEDGRTYLTRTTLGDRPVIRFAIGQTSTERRHVFEAWDAVQEIAAGLNY